MCSAVQVEAGEGRAGDQHQLAERDDDEQRRSARPCGRPRPAQSVVAERPSTGTQKPNSGADGFDADRDGPQRQPVPGRRAKAPAIQSSADAGLPER